jgi:hypothetical protein
VKFAVPYNRFRGSGTSQYSINNQKRYEGNQIGKSEIPEPRWTLYEIDPDGEQCGYNTGTGCIPVLKVHCPEKKSCEGEGKSKGITELLQFELREICDQNLINENTGKGDDKKEGNFLYR